MTKKIVLKPNHLALGGVFFTLMLAPRVVSYVHHQFEQELQQQEAATQAATLAAAEQPAPSQIGSERISETVLTRATYLLGKGRESGDVQSFIDGQYKAVNDQLWDLKQRIGVFDGNAEAFTQLTNLSAEQQAIELVQFWLANPEYVHTAQGMSLDVQTAVQPASNKPEVDYANVQP